MRVTDFFFVTLLLLRDCSVQRVSSLARHPAFNF
jgi:hypothetical protein